jgi:hypothetical protein
MDKKRLLGIVLMIVFLAAFIGWNLLGPVETETESFLRSLVGGLLLGGAVLSWVFLIKKRPAKGPASG